MDILKLWNKKNGLFTHLNCSQMMQILGWANLEPWIWPWVVAELVSLLALPYLYHQGEFFSSAAFSRSWGELSWSHALRSSSFPILVF